MHDLPQLSDVLVDVAKKLFRSLVLAKTIRGQGRPRTGLLELVTGDYLGSWAALADCSARRLDRIHEPCR